MTSLFVFWSIVSAIFMSPIVQHLSLVFFFFLASPSSGDWDDVEKSLQRVQREISKQPLTVTYCFRSLTGIKLKWSPMRRRMSDHHNFFVFLFCFLFCFLSVATTAAYTHQQQREAKSQFVQRMCVCAHTVNIWTCVFFVLFCRSKTWHSH